MHSARRIIQPETVLPWHRTIQRSGVIVAVPILSGLHHQYNMIFGRNKRSIDCVWSAPVDVVTVKDRSRGRMVEQLDRRICEHLTNGSA